MSGARLDRFYIDKTWNNKVMNAVILPVGFSDHHLVLFDLNMKTITKPNYFWHFNVKLLQDAFFVIVLNYSGINGKCRKILLRTCVSGGMSVK